MDRTFFSVIGLETIDLFDEKMGWPQVLFRSIPEQFITLLKWDAVNFNNDSFWKKHAEDINTLLHNRIKFEDKIYKNEDDVLLFISNNIPKYSPQDKLDIVLEDLHSRTSFDGETFEFNTYNHLTTPQHWRNYYFKNPNEFIFYLENLKSQELIKYNGRTNEKYSGLGLTLNGLTKLIKIKEAKSSNYCFIAMSFSKELESLYDNSLLPALNETGFLPLIIRNEHVDADKTITDAIIAAIKKARFTIADFTEHKNGVYFEAGFALGRGQKVIYTCKKDHLDKAHFDTRNFQHIVWETEAEFKALLVSKIEAYIID